MKRWIVLGGLLAACVLLLGGKDSSADKKPSAEKPKKSFTATCPVMGTPAIRDSFLLYRGKKLYFCCPGCPDQFDPSDKELTAKAHFQLLQTGQIRQVSCPLTGHDIDEAVSLLIHKQKVYLCCENCLKKMQKLSEEKRFAAVFSRPEKAFTLQTTCPVTNQPIDPFISLDYRGKRVFFRSNAARKTFLASPEKFRGKLPQFATSHSTSKN